MKLLYRYSALVLGLIYGMFLLVMALDSFQSGKSWEAIGGFIIHCLPSAVIVIATILGYFRPKYGFYIFLVISAAFTFYFHTYRNTQDFLAVSFPPLAITMLLFASSQNYRKK